MPSILAAWALLFWVSLKTKRMASFSATACTSLIEFLLLDYYYFVFNEDRVSKGKDQALIKKFDENGIPINKTYIDVTDKEYVYFPISIGQMG